MDQIFSVDTMQTQRVLDVTCGHLSLKDLLAFQRVTRQTRAAVRSHKYDRELVSLGNPKIVHPTWTAQLVGQDGSQLTGPILTRLCIELDLYTDTIKSKRRILDTPYGWDWFLSTLRLRAGHLRELELQLTTLCSLSSGSQATSQKRNRRADAALAGVVFPQCAKLRIQYSEHGWSSKSELLPGLLRHFPAVEHLQLHGRCLLPPLLSRLPSAEKLKTLDVNFYGVSKPSAAGEPLSVTDFSGLESLSVSFCGSRLLLIDPNCELEEAELISSDQLAKLNSLTGVDWMASYKNHPQLVGRCSLSTTTH